MANIQSQIKRNRQNEKRRLRNRDHRGSARAAVKNALTAISTGDNSKEAVARAISALDRAAQKGAIHGRNAARRKSRLLKRLAGPSAPAAAAAPKRLSPAPKGAAQKIAEPKAKKTPVKAAAKKAPAKKTTKK